MNIIYQTLPQECSHLKKGAHKYVQHVIFEVMTGYEKNLVRETYLYTHHKIKNEDELATLLADDLDEEEEKEMYPFYFLVDITSCEAYQMK